MHGTGRTVRTCTNRANSANRCEHCSVEPALDHHRPFSLESKVRLDHTLLRFRVRVHVRDSIFCDVRVRVHVRGLTICDVRRHECPCPPISGIHSWSARQNEFFKRAWESIITEKCLRKRKNGKLFFVVRWTKHYMLNGWSASVLTLTSSFEVEWVFDWPSEERFYFGVILSHSLLWTILSMIQHDFYSVWSLKRLLSIRILILHFLWK